MKPASSNANLPLDNGIMAVGSEDAPQPHGDALISCSLVTTHALRDLSRMSIDHVIELQLVAHVVKSSFCNDGCVQARKLAFLVDFFNDISNLKIMQKETNQEKGRVVANWINAGSTGFAKLAPHGQSWLKFIKRKWIRLRPMLTRFGRRENMDEDFLRRFSQGLDSLLESIVLDPLPPRAGQQQDGRDKRAPTDETEAGGAGGDALLTARPSTTPDPDGDEPREAAPRQHDDERPLPPEIERLVLEEEERQQQQQQRGEPGEPHCTPGTQPLRPRYGRRYGRPSFNPRHRMHQYDWNDMEDAVVDGAEDRRGGRRFSRPRDDDDRHDRSRFRGDAGSFRPRWGGSRQEDPVPGRNAEGWPQIGGTYTGEARRPGFRHAGNDRDPPPPYHRRGRGGRGGRSFQDDDVQ